MSLCRCQDFFGRSQQASGAGGPTASERAARNLTQIFLHEIGGFVIKPVTIP